MILHVIPILPKRNLMASESDREKTQGEDLIGRIADCTAILTNNIIGGVCAGIAAYFNIDSVWIRLAFVCRCFANGIGILSY